MLALLWFVFGALAAGGFIVFARRGGLRVERRVFAVGLAVAAALYMVFALIGWDVSGIRTEALGLAAFGMIALLGGRQWPWLLVIGWVLHVGWDVEMHLTTRTAYIGAWYPTLCISFDLAVAGYFGWRLRETQSTSP